MQIRQPFAVIGFSFAAALFLCSWLTIKQMSFLLPVVFLFFGLGLFLHIKKKGSLFLVISLVSFLAVIVSLTQQNRLWDIHEQTVDQNPVLTGVAVSGSADEGILIWNADLCWEYNNYKADVLLYGDSDLIVYPGETIQVYTSVQGIPSASQQGRGAQLVLRAHSDTLEILKDQPLWNKLRSKALSHIIGNLRRAIPDSEAAAMTIAILTGDDSAIPRRTYSLYQRSGIAHILCVSGLHLSILSGIILTALSFLGRRPALILSMVLMGIFVWLTGMGPSAVRAWIMTCLVMTAELFYRDSASVNSLGLAVLLLTLHEPALICRMGFLLSVSSVLAITAVAPSWQDTAIRLFRWEEKPGFAKLLGLFLPSVAVSLMTMPVMLLFTGYIPAISPLINMVILPLMPCLLICSLVTGLTGWNVTGTLCQKILRLFDIIAEIGSEGPILPLRSEIAGIGVGCCILLAVIVFLLKGRDYSRTAAGLLSITVLCGSYGIDVLQRQNHLLITQYTFSRSSSIVLQLDNRAVVIGAGASAYEGQKLTTELLANGVQKIDALIIPADKLGYTGGTYDLLTAMDVCTVISPKSSRVTQGLDFSTAKEFLLQDSLWNLFDQGTLRLHTGGSSAAVIIEWNGRQILLNESSDSVPWPADIRLIYDKKAEETDTTRENYAIMVSSGAWIRPAAELVLDSPEEST